MKDVDIKLQKAYMLTSLIGAYYDINSTGGSLHIVLDDYNYDKSSIDFCKEYSVENNDLWGIVMCDLLKDFNS